MRLLGDDVEQCALHTEVITNIKDRIEGMEAKQETIFNKIDDVQKNIMAAITKLLISVVVVVGSAAVGMVVYIATSLAKGAP
jgi:hypothetical protein